MTKVFIVEDDHDLRKLCKRMLKTKGYEVISASNGKEAVDLFKSLEVKPDVIMMDYKMPIKNGLDATKEILALDASSKIIMVTAHRVIKKEALALGVKSFILKPFSFKKLEKKIRKLARGKRKLFSRESKTLKRGRKVLLC